MFHVALKLSVGEKSVYCLISYNKFLMTRQVSNIKPLDINSSRPLFSALPLEESAGLNYRIFEFEIFRRARKKVMGGDSKKLKEEVSRCEFWIFLT